MAFVNIEPHQLPDLVEHREVEILDTRDLHSFAAGHLAGAKPASEENVRRLMRTRNRDRAILIYCYHGNSSQDLAEFFSGLGFREVFNLNGGWEAWMRFQQAGRAPAPQ